MGVTSWCDNAVLETVSGRLIDLERPDPRSISITDIAHALSMICRYNGHVPSFYTVAQHSVLVSRAVAPGWEREALMHDAAEAYVGDLTRPVKRALGPLNDHAVMEARVYDAVARRFGLRPLSGEVTLADLRVALAELRDLFVPPRTSPLLADGVVPIAQWVCAWPRELAQREFLDRFEELFGSLR